MTNVHIQPPICTDRALELSWKDSNIRYLDHLGNSDIAEKEYAELFEKAGYRLEQIIPTESPVSVIEAVPA